MARARSGGSVKPKLNILAYGPTGAGKSTILLNMAYFKREDGTPWRILFLDHESGGADEAIEDLAKNGIDTRYSVSLSKQSNLIGTPNPEKHYFPRATGYTAAGASYDTKYWITPAAN